MSFLELLIQIFTHILLLFLTFMLYTVYYFFKNNYSSTISTHQHNSQSSSNSNNRDETLPFSNSQLPSETSTPSVFNLISLTLLMNILPEIRMQLITLQRELKLRLVLLKLKHLKYLNLATMLNYG